jgi:hypothetical protein
VKPLIEGFDRQIRFYRMDAELVPRVDDVTDFEVECRGVRRF